jgi:hypothetical protein
VRWSRRLTRRDQPAEVQEVVTGRPLGR